MKLLLLLLILEDVEVVMEDVVLVIELVVSVLEVLVEVLFSCEVFVKVVWLSNM